MKVQSFSDLEKNLKDIKSPIILYSGGLDSSYLSARLKFEYDLDVTCLRVDVGQSDLGDISILENLNIKETLHDGKEELLNDFVYKSLHNGGMYGYGHFLSASLTRPLLAKTAVDLAKKIGSNCILHCAVPTQNSLRRFNYSISHLGFAGVFGSPFELDDLPREEKIAYLREKGATVNPHRTFSQDTNLWCREFEAGDLENISNFSVPEDNFKWTKISQNIAPQKIELTFHKGKLVEINGQVHSPLNYITYLNDFVGKFGIGRQISLEEGPISKVVEARECPAAHILSKAYYDLMVITFPRSLIENKMSLDQRWTTLACEGHWFSKEKKAIEKYGDYLADQISGTVSYQLSLAGITLNGVIPHQSKEKLEHIQLAS